MKISKLFFIKKSYFYPFIMAALLLFSHASNATTEPGPNDLTLRQRFCLQNGCHGGAYLCTTLEITFNVEGSFTIPIINVTIKGSAGSTMTWYCNMSDQNY